jgi:hypothetical protein
LVAVVLSGAIGCNAAYEVGERGPQSPGPVDVVVPAADPTLTRQVEMCGVFPVEAIDSPPLEGDDQSPEVVALRQSMDGSPESNASWRWVMRDASHAIFLGRLGKEWSCALFEWSGSKWAPRGFAIGGRLRAHIWEDLDVAHWWLGRSVERTHSVIQAFVEEGSCSSASYATGRIGSPLVEFTSGTITITFGVRPLRGDQSCMGNPPTPVILDLGEPIGDRVLLDGSTHPAHQPVENWYEL